MKLTSPAFKHNEDIPDHFTCMGEDVNPELVIDDIPAGTRSLVLTLLDPDSPFGTWIHWVVYDIKPARVIGEDRVPGTQGINTFKKLEYGGPCPAAGKHRYVFTIYALDMVLGLSEGIELDVLRREIDGHVLDSAELIGLYKKPVKPEVFKEINI